MKFFSRKIKIIIFLIGLALLYAEEVAESISLSLRPGNIAPFEKMLQRWRAVGNTLSDLTGPRFEPSTSRSRDQCIIRDDERS